MIHPRRFAATFLAIACSTWLISAPAMSATAAPASGRVIGGAPSGSLAMALDTRTGVHYVADSRHDSLKILDPIAGGLVGEVRVGDEPVAVTVDTFERRVYSLNRRSSDISVVDLGTGDSQTVPLDPGCEPASFALDPASHQIFVTSTKCRLIWVVNTDTRAVVRRLSVGVPTEISVDSGQGEVWFADAASDSIRSIDANVLTPGRTLTGFDDVRDLVLDTHADVMYIATAGDMVMLDVKDDVVLSRLHPQIGLTDLAFSGATNRLAMLGRLGSLRVFDTTAKSVVGAVDGLTGATSVAADPIGPSLWVLQPSINALKEFI